MSSTERLSLFITTDSYVTTLTIAATILTTIWLLSSRLGIISSIFGVSRYRLPPGPPGLPILGILPYMRKGNTDLMRLAKKYGNVFYGRMGSYDTVFLNDYDSIKEAFSRTDDVFNDRPRIPMYELYTQGHGIATCFLENHWKEQRRFTLRTLRNLGMGRTRGFLRNAIVCETEHLVEEWTKMDGRGSFSPDNLIEMLASNIACQLCFGKRFSYDDETFLEFVHTMAKVFDLADAAGIVNYIYFMRYVPLSGYYKMRHLVARLETGLFARQCEEHERTFHPGQEPRDVIDAFLMEIEKEKRMSSSTSSSFNKRQLINLIADIFAAGTDTSSTVLKWAFNHLIKYENVQQKVQDELDRVVGRDRLPTLEDKPSLPYTVAFITESLRVGAPGPLGMPHGAVVDTKLNGYDIPKGTVILANHFAVLRDPEVFPDPDVLNPDRFLDAEGKLNMRLVERANSQFGIGRRGCVGTELAHMERFICVSHVLHRFKLRAPNGPDSVSTEPMGGRLVYMPVPYQMELKCRK